MNVTTTPTLFEGAEDKQSFAEIIIDVIESKHRKYEREHRESGCERVPLANISFEIVRALNEDFTRIGDFYCNTGVPRLQQIAKNQGKHNENLLITAQRMLDLFEQICEIEKYIKDKDLVVYRLHKNGLIYKHLAGILEASEL